MYGLEAKELWIENPLLYADVEKYIWISNSTDKHREAQDLFYFFLRKKIYVKGFVTDSLSMVGLKMFHKCIYGIDVLAKDDAVLFCDLDTDISDIPVSDKVQYVMSVSTEMDRANVIVWGSGDAGEQIFHIFERNGVKIKYFVDSDEKKSGMTKCGLPVYLPKKLDSENVNFVIVEAMDRWKELDDMICNKYEKRFYYPCFQHQKFKQKYNSYITCEVSGIKENVLFVDSETFFYIGDKNIYIYGTGAIEIEAAKYFELMDYDLKGFLVDDLDSAGEIKSYPVKLVRDVLCENDYIIQVYDKVKVEKLDKLGLRYFDNYIYGMHDEDITIKRSRVLDINLGHNYLSQGKYPGFMVYGREKDEDYKIVTLGNSTTDGTIYSFKSWSQLLYEKIGGNVTVYNGGVYAYNSGQEVIKLIRDVLVLKPDMIIVYDGFCDMYCKDEYPYSSMYLGRVFRYSKAHIDMENYREENKGIVCRGIASQDERFDNWLSNIRTMHAIASERGIQFFCFCQPALCSKRGKTIQEKCMLLSTPGEYIDFQVKKSFREYMGKRMHIPSYIYDLSDIFDDTTDIYMDICHVREEGNKMIAHEMEKVILPALKESSVL